MSDILPATGILEIEMEEPKIMQIGSYSPSSACNAKVLDVDGICPTLLDHKGMEPAIAEPLSCALRGRNPENPSDRRTGAPTEQRLELGGDVANCLTSVQKDSMILVPKRTETAKELRRQGIEVFANRELVPREGGCSNTITTVQKDNLLQESYVLYDNQFGDFWRNPIEGLARTLKADHHNAVLIHYRIRKLTERECFRLMDVDDADIDKIDACRIKTTLKDGTVKLKPIPKSQKYKMAGNSIVVSCLYHIFYQMFIAEPPVPKPRQLSLFD